jgi:peptide methionine sulfoxide reductase MsrA
LATKAVYAGGMSNFVPTYYTLDNTTHSEALMITCEGDIDLQHLLEVIITKSKDDPSPQSKPRYHRGLLCESKELADILSGHLSGIGEYPGFNIGFPLGQVHIAEDYHQDYYARVLA